MIVAVRADVTRDGGCALTRQEIWRGWSDQQPATSGQYRPRRPAVLRTCAEMAALFGRARADVGTLVASAAPGNGSCVMVMPGVFRSDAQTSDLRLLLARLGYRAEGWELGRNLGPTKALMAGALARLRALAANGPVALVGFSMGGLFARWLAQREPALVRRVITIGSPWRAPVHSLWVPSPLVRLAWPNRELANMAAEVARPLRVPTTSLYSRCDGIVAWQSCLDPETPDANLEVGCPHVLMEQDAGVFRYVAELLAR